MNILTKMLSLYSYAFTASLDIANMTTWQFWLVLLILFLVVEGITVGLVSIWFAVGSLVALVLNLKGAPFLVQVLAMLIVSLVFLVVFLWRRKDKKKEHHATNWDRLIGEMAEVTQDIDPVEGKGQILVSGVTWSAKSVNGEAIEKGAKVQIEAVQGVKALVKKVE